MICVKIFFNICHSKRNSDSNVCPNSSRGLSFNDSMSSTSISWSSEEFRNLFGMTITLGLEEYSIKGVDDYYYIEDQSFAFIQSSAEEVPKHYINSIGRG